MRLAIHPLLSRLVDDRKIIVLTFEIFWISVFLLEALARPSGGESASFVYANF